MTKRSLWHRFLGWLGPAVDDSTGPRPQWYRFGPTLLVLAVLVVEFVVGDEQNRTALGVLHGIAASLFLLDRRRWPIGTFAGAFAVGLAAVGVHLAFGWRIEGSLATVLVYQWFLYNGVRWAQTTRYHLIVGLIALTSASFILDTFREPDRIAAEGGLAAVLIPWVLFDSLVILVAVLRRRHCAQADEQKRLDELETRNALANEVHDVVGHHLSAIAMRAEGARSLVTLDEHPVDEALVAIKRAAASALDEIRGLVESLSAASEDLVDSGPTIDEIGRLCDDDLGGPEISLTVDLSSVEPSPQVSHAAYRIVQEAITNARRHAPGATRIDVSIRSDQSNLIIDVRDDGGGGLRGLPIEGHGLQAMSSRAALVQGDFSAGPVPTGGWAVAASLPL